MERNKTQNAVDALKLMHFATSLDPSELTRDSPGGKVGYILKQAKEANIYGSEPDPQTTAIFTQGVADVSSIINNAFTDYGESIPQERALEIATHDLSVDTIALYASLPEKMLRRIISDQRHYNYQLSQGFRSSQKEEHVRCFVVNDTQGAIGVNPNYDDSWNVPMPERGCPFAQPVEKRPPAFDNFVRWAGKVAVLRYNNQA